MKRARFTEEQIIAVLKEHEAGAKTADLARKHGISEATIYNWKSKYGGMEVNEAKTAGFIVVTTDKGLCGGMNTNVLRAVTNKLRELQSAGQSAQAVAIGNKGLGFLNRIGVGVVSHVTQLGDTPHLDKLIGPVKVLLDAY